MSNVDDLREWNDLRAAEESPSILHDPAFSEIVARTYRCAAKFAVVRSQAGNTGVPAYCVSHSLFGHKVTSQPFSFYPGLLGAHDEVAAVRYLVDVARAEGHRCFVEYKTFTPLAPAWVDAVGPLQQIAPLVDSQLALPADEAAQLQRYSKSFRQNLRTTGRRAAREGVVLGVAEHESDVREFYGVLCRNNRDKHHTLTHPLSLYLDFFRLLRPQGKADFLLARRGNRVIAGIVILRSARHWEYVWAASRIVDKTLGLNTLLVDQMIRDALAAGVRTIGFGASSPKDAELLYFKSRWGCTHRPVYFTYWNHAPAAVDLVSGYGFVRKVFPWVPTAVLAGAAPWVVPLLA